MQSAQNYPPRCFALGAGLYDNAAPFCANLRSSVPALGSDGTANDPCSAMPVPQQDLCQRQLAAYNWAAGSAGGSTTAACTGWSVRRDPGVAWLYDAGAPSTCTLVEPDSSACDEASIAADCMYSNDCISDGGTAGAVHSLTVQSVDKVRLALAARALHLQCDLRWFATLRRQPLAS